MVNSFVFLESVTEEQELILDRVHPVDPVMCSRACSEFVWYALREKFIVKVAVHFVEEIFCSAVNNDIHCTWLEKVGQIYHSVLVPVVRMLFYSSDSFCDAPFLRERTEIYAS